MLCRGVLGRIANEATKQSTTDVTQIARHLRRINLSNNVANPVRASRAAFIPLTRSYATTTPHRGRPKKGSPGEKAAKTRSRTTASKAPAKKKAAPKKRAAAPKKKAAPKRKAKPKTEAQVERAEVRKKAKELRELKKTALLGKEPKRKPYTAWTVFASENVPKGMTKDSIGSVMKENAAKYKDLTASEKEHYNHLANQNKLANDAAYKQWVESHSAEEIRLAQAARRRLKQLMKVKKGSSAYSPIQDQRQVKRPVNAHNLYLQDRYASGDFKTIGFGESAKLIMSEFKALTPSEKKKYEDLYEKDTERYKREFKRVYGHDAPMFNHSAAATATATA